VHEPAGAHPSSVQGYWDRDNRFYREWDSLSRDEAAVERWLDEWVRGVTDREDYRRKIGDEHWEGLRPKVELAAPINYGAQP
jgi:glutaconate CoA-transferase subunit A